MTDIDNNYGATLKTDTTGAYQFKLVPPGNYSLLISAASFADYLQKGIVINANLYATQNVHLKVASAKGETVSVTADAELIDTTSAELGMTVNEDSVSELPLNGRDPSTLALLAPGMVDATKAGVALGAVGIFVPERVSGLGQWRPHRQHLLYAGRRLQHGHLPGHATRPRPTPMPPRNSG